MKAFYIGVSVLAFAAGDPAAAQADEPVPLTSAGSTEAEDDRLVLEDIVVTARRRSEAAQDVPVPLTALSGERLLAAGAVTTQDLAQLTPGLFFQSFDASRPQLYIRGIGTRNFDIGSESSVGIFVDGVYFARFGAQIQDLADIERVEVLKGPQGTLFGRNTIGGAISISTRRPTDKWAGRVIATYGIHDGGNGGDEYRLFASIGGPIAPKVLGQFTAARSDSDGWSRIVNTGQLCCGQGSNYVRGRLLFELSEQTTLDVAGDYLDTYRGGAAYRRNDVNGTRPNYQFQLPFGPVLPTLADPYDIETNIGSDLDRKNWGVSATLNVESDVLSLTSITAYRDLKLDSLNDLDASAFEIYESPISESSSQFSQEVRLASANGGAFTFGDRVEWLLGASFFTEKARRTDSFLLGPQSNLGFFVGGRNRADLGVTTNTSSYAIFGQVGFKLTERLRLDAGLRYTIDDKRAAYDTRWRVPIPAFGLVDYQLGLRPSFNSLDPSVALSYRVEQDALLFASYGRGFKSGAFQYAATNPAVAARFARPEKVDAYQLGIKSDLFDRRLRLNATAFQYDYTNLQVLSFASINGIPSPLTTNAASSRIRGFEIEGAAAITPELTLEYGYSYLDANYRRYVFSPERDYTGNRMPRSPEHTLTAALSYSADLDFGRLNVRGSIYHTSSFFFEPDAGRFDTGTREPGYTLADASIGLEFGNGLTTTFWGRNLGNEAFRATVFNTPGVQLIEVWGPRRAFGITLSAGF